MGLSLHRRRARPGRPGQACDGGHFRNAWRKGQSEEEQAAYVAAGVRLLLTYPNCMGFLFYSWGDDEICWHCGKPTAPPSAPGA